MITRNQKGFSSVAILAVLMSIAFIGALIFAIWAFIGMQENQTNLNQKIEAASDVAVERAEAAKEIEFTERDKSPFKRYTGPSIYGALSFDYPKSWSVYVDQKDSGTLLDLYAHPNIIPGLDREIAFAFRVQILNSTYDKEVEEFDSLVERGDVSSTAVRLAKVPSESGLLVSGEIEKDKQGQMLLLAQRDKTIRIWTESQDFVNDYNKIIESVTFVP